MSQAAAADMPPPSAAAGVLAMAHSRQPGPNIPLSRLVEFAVQRTYHELEVLANL